MPDCPSATLAVELISKPENHSTRSFDPHVEVAPVGQVIGAERVRLKRAKVAIGKAILDMGHSGTIPCENGFRVHL